MAEKNPSRSTGLDTPRQARARLLPRLSPNPDAFGSMTEKFARFMGTPQFLLYMTVFCFLWLAWNTMAPEHMQFDPRALNFTLLTLMLSLQASYAAPLLLLAQNRQDDRDRVALEQDRQQAARNLANTDYLNRELASVRIALREVATRDFIRSELRSLLEDLQEDDAEGATSDRKSSEKKTDKRSENKPGRDRPNRDRNTNRK